MDLTMHAWDHVWIGAELATLRDDVGIGHVSDGVIAVRGQHIAWVGTRAQLVRMSWSADSVTDCRGERIKPWITPGLIDCHTHLVYAGDRSDEFAARQEGRTYEEIARAGGGIAATVRATRAASETELLEQSLPRARALVCEGVTTLEIKSGYGLCLDTERKILRTAREIGTQLGINVVTTFLGAHTVPHEFAGRADDYIRHICDTMLPALAKEGLVDAVDAFCERIAFTPEQTATLFATAQRLGLPVRLHADQLSDSGGGELAARFNAGSADHLEHASEASLQRMAESGIVAGLLPGAYYYLRDTHVPPIARLRELKIPMAVATDCNPGTSPMNSLLLAMNMACVLFGLTPDEALRGVTRAAAQALGLQRDRGMLAAGMRADFAVWNIRHAAQLSAQIGLHRPSQIVVAGKPLRRHGGNKG
jgi:imidazolonepropionase